MTRQQIDYEKLLFLYSCALEDGDFEAIQHILAQAEHDIELMTQLREIESVYQAELQSPRMAEMRVPLEVSHVNSANGHVASAVKSINLYPSNQPKPHRGKILMRIAILILTILGGFFTYIGTYQDDSPVLVTEIPAGQSATMLPQADRVPITVDNADQLTVLASYGENRSDNGAVWSNDGSQILVYGSQGITVYDAKTFEIVDTVDIGKTIIHLVSNPTKPEIALITSSNELIIMDWETQNILAQRELSDEYTFILQYNPDGKYLVTVESQATEIHLWNSETAEPYMILRGLHSEPHLAVFSPNGQYLAIAGMVEKLDYQSPENGKPFREVVYGVAVWDIELGVQVGVYYGTYDYISSLVYGADGEQLIATDSRGKIIIWDTTETQSHDAKSMFGGRVPQFDAVEILETDDVQRLDGFWLADTNTYMTISMNYPIHIQYWDFITQEIAETLNIDGLLQQSIWSSQNQLNPSQQQIILRYFSKVQIVDLTTQKVVGELPLGQASWLDLEFNNTTSSLAVRGLNNVTVWDVESGDELNTLDNANAQGSINDIQFSKTHPDLLLIGGAVHTNQGMFSWDINTDDVDVLWDTSYGTPLVLDANETDTYVYANYDGEVYRVGPGVNSILVRTPLTDKLNMTAYYVFDYPEVYWANMGDVVVKDYSTVIYVLDGETGEIKTQLAGHIDIITNIAFSPDKSVMVSVDYAGTLIVWDTATWTQVAKVNDFSKHPYAVSIASDNRLVAVASDGDVMLWDSETQTTLATLENTGGAIKFSPDGTLLATVKDSAAVVWGIAQ